MQLVLCLAFLALLRQWSTQSTRLSWYIVLSTGSSPTPSALEWSDYYDGWRTSTVVRW